MKDNLSIITDKMKILNSFQLKWIAIISMTIDHIGVVLYPQYYWMRIVGRLAFPIFAFLLVQGMIYTKDAKKYLIRLGAFALISELPYDITFRDSFFDINKQNVFFTLFLGALAIYIYQTAEQRYMQYSAVVFLSVAAEFLNSEYGLVGVWMIFALFYARDNLFHILLVLLVFNVGISGGTQVYAAFAFIPIAMYNYEKGSGNKYFFYTYYPAHMLVLTSLAMLIN